MASFLDAAPGRPKSALDRILSLAADVHAGEGLTVLLLAVNGFLLLAAYYTIRPLRSALLLPVQISLPGGGVISGSEITSYLGAAFAAMFLVIVPLYGSIAETCYSSCRRAASVATHRIHPAADGRAAAKSLLAASV